MDDKQVDDLVEVLNLRIAELKANLNQLREALVSDKPDDEKTALTRERDEAIEYEETKFAKRRKES